MNNKELFSEFHRILEEQGQGKNCFEVFNEDKTQCIFYVETTEHNQTIKPIADIINNSVERSRIDKAIGEIENRSFDNEPIIVGMCLDTYRKEVLEILKRNMGE